MSQIETAIQEGGEGSQGHVPRVACKGDWPALWVHTAEPRHSELGPTPSPWGRVLGGQSDLEADGGQLHDARDADGVDAVEGHAVGILHEEVPVHGHLPRDVHVAAGGPQPGGSTPEPLGPLLLEVETCI